VDPVGQLAFPPSCCDGWILRGSESAAAGVDNELARLEGCRKVLVSATENEQEPLPC
jgi:hypothetical protein